MRRRNHRKGEGETRLGQRYGGLGLGSKVLLVVAKTLDGLVEMLGRRRAPEYVDVNSHQGGQIYRFAMFAPGPSRHGTRAEGDDRGRRWHCLVEEDQFLGKGLADPPRHHE